MIYARQSTAIIVTVGPVLDASGVAVTTSVVGDFLVSKNGAAPAALNGSATLTHRNTGHYSLSLTATDVNTVGTAEIVINATTNACPIKEITVVEEAIYDALFAASANGFAGAAGASTVTFSNTSIATVTTATNVTTVNGLAANVITAAATAADFSTEVAGVVADAVWDEDATAHQTQGTFGQAVGDPGATAVSIWSQANKLIFATNNYLSVNVEAVNDDDGIAPLMQGFFDEYGTGIITISLVGDLNGNVTGNVDGNVGGNVTGTIGGFTTSAKAEIQIEANDALVANNLDHLLAVAAVAGDVVNSSIIARLTSKSATPAFTSFDNTTDSLEAIRDRGDVAWITSTLTAADVWAAGTRTLTAATNITSTGGTITVSSGIVTANLNTSQATTGIFADDTVGNMIQTLEKLTVDGSGQVTVGSIAAGAINAAAIDTGAIDADALATDAANEIADALLDRSNGIETGLTPRNALRLIAAASAGEISGAATTTVVIRNAVADSKDRITATVTADGDRTAITTDLT